MGRPQSKHNTMSPHTTHLHVGCASQRKLAVLAAIATALTVLLLAAACGGDDDGAEVRKIGGEGSGSASASGSASGPASPSASPSGSASASGSALVPAEAENEPAATPADGAFAYASNVDSHRLVVADICQINGLLDAEGGIDFAAIETIYRDGEASVKGDGTVRSIGGFAARDDRKHGLNTYYGTAAPLDDFITEALTGTGRFEGEADAVRSQGIEKGIQNQAMVAWVRHELASALAKAADGNFAIADGAVHNWDEGWAFYHGSEPGCAPYATGDKRAGNFGTLAADGEMALANERIAAAMIDGRDALVAGDAARAEAAAVEVVRNIVIIYSQAAVRYATLIEGDLAEGDAGSAREHQAEGLAFWRVIEALVAGAGADVTSINTFFDLANQPAPGGGELVGTGLEPAWAALGISAEDIGELQ